jgi:hypothetical protein
MGYVAGMKEHAFCRGRLACIDVGNDSDIANPRDIEVRGSGVGPLWGSPRGVETERRVGSGRGMSAQTQQDSVCPHALHPPRLFFWKEAIDLSRSASNMHGNLRLGSSGFADLVPKRSDRQPPRSIEATCTRQHGRRLVVTVCGPERLS